MTPITPVVHTPDPKLDFVLDRLSEKRPEWRVFAGCTATANFLKLY